VLPLPGASHFGRVPRRAGASHLGRVPRRAGTSHLGRVLPAAPRCSRSQVQPLPGASHFRWPVRPGRRTSGSAAPRCQQPPPGASHFRWKASTARSPDFGLSRPQVPATFDGKPVRPGRRTSGSAAPRCQPLSMELGPRTSGFRRQPLLKPGQAPDLGLQPPPGASHFGRGTGPGPQAPAASRRQPLWTAGALIALAARAIGATLRARGVRPGASLFTRSRYTIPIRAEGGRLRRSRCAESGHVPCRDAGRSHPGSRPAEAPWHAEALREGGALWRPAKAEGCSYTRTATPLTSAAAVRYIDCALIESG
jgi:hypothetical protein